MSMRTISVKKTLQHVRAEAMRNCMDQKMYRPASPAPNGPNGPHELYLIRAHHPLVGPELRAAFHAQKHSVFGMCMTRPSSQV